MRRTLLIVLASGPPVLVWYVWPTVRAQYVAWQWRRVIEAAKLIPPRGGGFVAEDKSPAQ